MDKLISFGLIVVTFLQCFVLCGGLCELSKRCFPNEVEFFGKTATSTANSKRSVTVSSTCGGAGSGNPEKYKPINVNDTTEHTCLFGQHTKDHLLDKILKEVKILGITRREILPVYTTYWQSKTTISAAGAKAVEQTILLNLTDTFLINKISMAFIAPHGKDGEITDGRPKALFIERLTGDGSWKAWRYYAKDCTVFSGVPVHEASGANLDANSTFCQQVQFGGHGPTQKNETGLSPKIQLVDFHPSLEFTSFFNSKKIQEHYITSAIRIRLVQPVVSDPLRSFYALADLSVSGMCQCYGHSDKCIGDNANNCECGHNTAGAHCEKCLPLYNNKPWKMAVNNNPNVCELCSCNNHAASCHYDEKKKRGVCDACLKNTKGDTCEECLDGYHINPAYLPNATVSTKTGLCNGYDGTAIRAYNCSNYCIPCNCEVSGSDAASKYFCDLKTGQCTCKTFVTGTRCDECKDTYWNLNRANPVGCELCNCDTKGSFKSSNFCDKKNGSCVCKTNVKGKRCDACKPGSFNLQQTNVVDGCTLCDCDPGGSSQAECNVQSGQCPCRPNIEDRTCKKPVNNYFVPKYDYFTFDVEFQNKEGNKLEEIPGHGNQDSTVTGRGGVQLMPGNTSSVELEVPAPLTKLYDVIVRYKISGTGSVTVKGEITMEGSTEYTCGGQKIPAGKTWTETKTVTGPNTRGALILQPLCMKAAQKYVLKLTSIATNTLTILIDSVVLLPDSSQLSVYTSADNTTKKKMDDCRQASMSVNLAQKASLNCSTIEYSLMAEFIGGATKCNCNTGGTLPGKFCDPMGGQCACKDNVIMRRCETCKVDSFGLNIVAGCTACNCNMKGSVRASCNGTGHCECKTNVVGTKCDTCLPNHYGLHTGAGCQPCQCNLSYSYNNSCADSGQCPCKPGVGGLLCNQCLDGYFNLTSQGCVPCNCHPHGSTNPVCNKQTGTCSCKTTAAGDKCSECKPGYFGVGPWSKSGCMKCFCSGHSTNCSTAKGWYTTTTESYWSFRTGGAVDDRWLGQDDQGNDVTIESPTFLDTLSGGLSAQYVMQITNNAANQNKSQLFFLATQKFLGDKSSAYARQLVIILRMSTNESILPTYPEGDVILKGQYLKFSLTRSLLPVPASVPTKYTLTMREDEWHVNTIQGRKATYEELIKTLSVLETFKIRGKFNNATDAKVELFRVTLAHARKNQTNGSVPINNVEQCVCPKEYSGQLCDICSNGYRRQSLGTGRFGTCISCNCNGHAGGPCDFQTGICRCTHNTTGPKCAKCRDGFYGNALAGTPDDCKPCLCPGNVIAGNVNVFAKTCELDPTTKTPVCHNCTVGHGGKQCEICVKNFYGQPEDSNNNNGKCSPCKCNNRADTCNSTTGMCINCRNNTAGKECNICGPFYSGDPMTSPCKPCGCKTSLGSTGECNHVTGKCLCRPNVSGFNCDACVPNAFNFSSGKGCQMCDCHLVGAIGTGCNLTTGQCLCRSHVVGRQCNICEDTYWNLKAFQGCQPCGCNPQGISKKPGETPGKCDMKTGQCVCSSAAIIGRTCDTCSPVTRATYKFVQTFHLGKFPNCELCGECYDSWARKIDEIGQSFFDQDNKTKDIWKHYGNLEAGIVIPVLKNIQRNIGNAEQSIKRASNVTTTLTGLQAELQTVLDRMGNLSSDCDKLQQQRDESNGKLANVTQFSGVVDIDNVTKVSESILQVQVANLVKQIENFYSVGNKTWSKIQQLSFLVGSADGSVRQLQGRVSTAMKLLLVAKGTYDTAKKIHDETFIGGFNSNMKGLESANKSIMQAQAQLNDLKITIAKVSAQFTAANQKMSSIVTASSQRRTELAKILEDSKKTQTEASATLVIAQNAASVVTNYKTIAEKAKKDISNAFRDIIEGVTSLQNVQKLLNEMTKDMALTMGTTLRPLSELQAITAKIQKTAISNTAVTATNQKAESALTIARTSLQSTQKAMDDSQKALEEVQGIQENLKAAAKLRSEAEALKAQNDAHNTTIYSAVNEVQTKGTEAQTLAQSTSVSVSLILNAVTTINQCYAKKESEAANAQALAATASQQMDVVIKEQTSVNQIITTLDTENAKKNYATPLADIQTTNAQLDGVKKSFADVESVANLSGLIQDYIRQRDEMLITENSLAQMETQLDTIIQALGVNSVSSTCATN